MSNPEELFRCPTLTGGMRPSLGGEQHLTHGHLYIGDSTVNCKASLISKVTPFKYKGKIKVVGDLKFIQSIEQCFKEIETTDAGKKLVTALINKSKVNIHVTISKGTKNKATPTSVGDGWKKGEYIMYDHLDLPVTYGNKGTGKGCGTDIKLNFNFKFPNGKKLVNVNMPPAIILTHELLHAYLFANGLADPSKKNGTRNHERQVIGLSPYNNEKLTENKIRAEWKPPLPLRTTHLAR